MKKKRLSQHKSKAFDVAKAISQAERLNKEGRFKEALDSCLRIAHACPDMGGAWGNAAVNCIKIGRWQDAIRYSQNALARGGRNEFTLYDALAHAHGYLGQWDETRRHGLQALNIRARRFGSKPVIPLLEVPPMPPPPSAQTRENNVIAFSLFGGNCKYCEPAVLNTQEQPSIYPHWVCRFYVDGSVPEHVINRLRQNGAQIVQVNGPASEWPGPMWRFLALDDPQAHRILFRDADSVISRREAAAVEQWLASGKRFHMMRDWCSHTELILAGLWGVVAGSLPPLERLMQHFMSMPLGSEHFADQFFLREYVWPYARLSLMQHDSMFGFMDSLPFPYGEWAAHLHVGCLECRTAFGLKTDLPPGSEVVWALYRLKKSADGQSREELICSYPGVVKDGEVRAHIPERYAQWIEQGTACVRLIGNRP
jgi:hypothetical protein